GNGRVLDDGKTLPMNVKVGDTVVYDKYAGTEVTYEDQKYLVVHEKDLVAVVE
ncbi:co-chaperone GroES, partial [Lactiplantibacillus plantarum]|nr:co-chaperone GroES [Lactiplantibacillus plantarum]